MHNCFTRDDKCVVFEVGVDESGLQFRVLESVIDCLLVTSSCMWRSNYVFLKLLQAGVGVAFSLLLLGTGVDSRQGRDVAAASNILGLNVLSRCSCTPFDVSP